MGLFILTFFMVRGRSFVRRGKFIVAAIGGALGRLCAIFCEPRRSFVFCARCVARAPHAFPPIYMPPLKETGAFSRHDVSAF